jgi:selenide,water dikinase
MVTGSGLGVRVFAKSVPILPGTLDYAGMGLVPAGAFKNRKFYEPVVELALSLDQLTQDVLFDPQTSGGLLISLDEQSAESLVTEIEERGIRHAAIIGEVVSKPKERIVVVP